MAGQRQKAPALLANRRGGRGRGLEVIRSEQRVVPRPPSGLGPYARRAWREFWRSDVSLAVDYAAHGEELRHWVWCIDRRQRYEKLIDKNPLVLGSHKQLMINPLVRVVARLTDEIHWAAIHFGMTPLATWRMQLTVTEAARSANDLRRELMRPVDEDPVDDDGIIDGDLL